MNKTELMFLYCTHLCARHSEVWLPIKGYPKYEVSSRGRVRSIKLKFKKILKAHKRDDGYIDIELRRNGKSKKIFLHRIVCSTFWPNPSRKKYVDHIDHKRMNNVVTNLRWATREENSQNKSKMANNTTGVTGVVWSKDKKRWRARITFNGKVKHLGYFKSLETAKEVRIRATARMFKEFANREAEE